MAQQDLAINQLSRDELQALRNKRTAVTVFQFSWILVFVCLIVVNLQLRSTQSAWPPVGVQPLDRVLPTIATVGLLASMWLARGGLKAIGRDSRASFLRQWGLAIGLGAAFVLVMAYEWVSVQFSGQYSTVFRLMTAYHAIHALVIGGLMVRAYVRARAGAYSARAHWDVEAAAKLWYFVAVAWLLFYLVLYVI